MFYLHFFWENLPQWLFWLFFAALFTLLGWLLCRMFSNCQQRIRDLEEENNHLRNSNKATTSGVAAAATSSFAAGKKKRNQKKDDLTKIEGIGPKIQDLCNDIGIYTYVDLATTSVANLQKMLDDGGSAFTVHVPHTWPKQADMADKGLWDELKIWQDTLEGGKL